MPGGHIQKDETLTEAFARILQVELALTPQEVSIRSIGVYQHFYEDNFSGADFPRTMWC